ncbi:uncharacterized protein RSE6_12860 [Rhynchosporium secalis]|uniref:Uncharacterized protein n=1 Tax=Rhynchosporium secalis TaxID=38038 RepID=A0A1E1MRF6_RHYSE|nr:uncharacterized protein RSE6_12860 [Rhynchosporium secalis]
MRSVFSLLFLGLSALFAVTQAVEIQRIRRVGVLARQDEGHPVKR